LSRSIIITGGTGGLGTALAQLLLDAGDRVAITYLLPEEAARFEEEIGLDESKIKLRRVDATGAEPMKAFMNEVATS